MYGKITESFLLPYALPEAAVRAYMASAGDGGICRVCGGLMIRTGSCETCTQCGETTGCG